MQQRFGFTRLSVSQFAQWLDARPVARTITSLQHHHTYRPDYKNFTGSNHFGLQKGMRDYHVIDNGWQDIGQHLTIFPDGAILTGRSMEHSPACIYRNNANAICIENLGCFDEGGDVMQPAQENAIIAVSALLCEKFSIPVTTGHVVYHHWFRLNDGLRNDGAGNNKSCPGTAFFGGNKPEDCRRNLLPPIRKRMTAPLEVTHHLRGLQQYVAVTASKLNIRTGPSTRHKRVPGAPAAAHGAILRVFESKNDWLRIARSGQRWVYGRYTQPVTRQMVTASQLNIREQPSVQARIAGTLANGDEVFVYEQRNNWGRIGPDERWVSTAYLKELN